MGLVGRRRLWKAELRSEWEVSAWEISALVEALEFEELLY